MVFAGTEDDDGASVVLIRDFVYRRVIGKIQVVGFVRSGGGESIYALHYRDYAERETLLPDLVLTRLRNRIFIQCDGDLAVGEALLLGPAQQVLRQGGDIVTGIQLTPGPDDVGELVEEPLVNLGQVVDPVDGPAERHGLCDVEDTGVGGIGQGIGKVLHFVRFVTDKAIRPLPYHPEAFLDGLLEGQAYGHHLSDGLHAGADLARNPMELAEIPAGNLAHDILHVGLIVRALGTVGVLDLGEFVSETYLGGDERKRISSGFGSKRRGTAETGVDFDDAVVHRGLVIGELDVALTHYAQMTDYLLGQSGKVVDILLRKALAGSKHYALSGMDAQRVEILHVADRDAPVRSIAYDFELYLLPALQ